MKKRTKKNVTNPIWQSGLQDKVEARKRIWVDPADELPYHSVEAKEEIIEGTKRGVEAYKQGKIKPWPDVKKELGLLEAKDLPEPPILTSESEQAVDDAIGEAFYNFLHGYDSAKCVRAIRDAFKSAGYCRAPTLPDDRLREEIIKTIAKHLPSGETEEPYSDLHSEIADDLMPYFAASKAEAVKQAEMEGWELQDKLLAMTVLNQNAPKIVLTNDECGWSISYYPDPPNTKGGIGLTKDNPLEAVRALEQALSGEAQEK